MKVKGDSQPNYNNGEMPEKLGGHPRFHELLKQMSEVHAKKSHDYANPSDPFANLRESRTIKIPPYVGCFIRMLDKVNRIKSFINKGKLKNESFADACLDLACYSIICLILYEEDTDETKKV